MGNSASGSGQAFEFAFNEPDVDLDVWYKNGSFVSNSKAPKTVSYYNNPKEDGFWLKVAIWSYDSYDAVRISIWHNRENVTQDFQLGVQGLNLKRGGYKVNVLALDGHDQEDFYFNVDRNDREGLYWKIHTMYSNYLLKGSVNDGTRLVVWVNTNDFLNAVNDLGLTALDVFKSNEMKIEVARRIIPTPVSALGSVIPVEPLIMPLTIAFVISVVGVFIWNAIENALTVKRTTTLYGKQKYTTLYCDGDSLKALLNGPTSETGFLTHARNVMDARGLHLSTEQAYHPIFNPSGEIDVGFGTPSSCSLDDA